MAHDIQIVRSVKTGAVVDEIVTRLESELSMATGWPLSGHKSSLVQKLARRGFIFTRVKRRAVLMVMMGTYRIPLNAADWLSAETPRAAWLFDAWPNSHDDLCRFVAQYRLTHLFVTALQAAETLSQKLDQCHVEWVPEPLVDIGFLPVPWSERDNLVIQFGRRYDLYHDALLAGMKGDRFAYRFEQTKGDVLFKDAKAFVEALGKAKVSVCFPCNLTHPDRAGGVSTMTQRFLQSMASGCVIVGQSPPEMIKEFGYDPVVSADMDDPAGQIERILGSPNEYLALIDRNLETARSQRVDSRVRVFSDSLHL